MISIQPIETHHRDAAIRVICKVVCEFFHPSTAPEYVDRIVAAYMSRSEFQDIVEFESHYELNRGLFLVLLDGDRVVGTGGIRRLDDATAEVKRMWLLPEYRGRGYGRGIMDELLQFARNNNYERVRLDTNAKQLKAIALYKRVGFYEIAAYNDGGNDLFMEVGLGGLDGLGG